MELTHADIADIIRLIDASTLDELVLEVGDVRIEVRRKGAGPAPGSAPVAGARAAAAASAARPAAVVAPVPVMAAAEVAVDATIDSGGAPALAAGQIAITAPMVGTFYRRPSPDADPFVSVGARVEVGDPLCLVEVMKLYTTIAAEHVGTVVAVGAEDAALVEYGQVLFVIEPD